MCHCPDDLPDRLRRHGRQVIPIIPPEDSLYFRFQPPQMPGVEIGDLELAHIKPPNQSLNLGSLSEPVDVLYRQPPGWGIACLLVRDIRPSIVSDGGPVYHLGAVHDPLECTTEGNEFCNYSHVEIRIFKENEHGERIRVDNSKSLPPNVKLKYRAMIRDAARVHTPSRKLAA